jgi:hypothetical protein
MPENSLLTKTGTSNEAGVPGQVSCCKNLKVKIRSKNWKHGTDRIFSGQKTKVEIQMRKYKSTPGGLSCRILRYYFRDEPSSAA